MILSASCLDAPTTAALKKAYDSENALRRDTCTWKCLPAPFAFPPFPSSRGEEPGSMDLCSEGEGGRGGGGDERLVLLGRGCMNYSQHPPPPWYYRQPHQWRRSLAVIHAWDIDPCSRCLRLPVWRKGGRQAMDFSQMGRQGIAGGRS